MDIIKVACGIIYKKDKIFLCRRKPNKTLGGYWEFPGGKIEPGEHVNKALSRELIEELGMRVKVEEHFFTNVHNYGHFKIELIALKCVLIDSKYSLIDHDQYVWIDPAHLNQFNLAPADIPIAQELMIKQ